MSKRILVIDDDQAVRKSFMLALEDTEYQVDTAESGEKGIEKERKSKYDLIFLDFKMPGLDGVDTLRELRLIDKDVPIYIVTAFHREFLSKLKEVEKEGINFEIFQKPIGHEQITLLAQSVLEKTAISYHDGDGNYELILYVSGETPNSAKSIRNLRTALENEVEIHYILRVIDLLEKPGLGDKYRIFATPTVVKELPLPVRKIIGDLSNKEKVLVGLNLIKKQ